jgi:hypothetical protein
MIWRFKYWQDGDVNVQKTITLTTDTTLTAYYEEVVTLTATIKGFVTDAETKEPIVGATVICNGYIDTTEADGSYQFVNIPAAKYTLTVQKEGYQTQTAPVDASSGGTFQKDFNLSLTPPKPPIPKWVLPAGFIIVAGGIIYLGTKEGVKS